jgi:hypothetical protein
MPEIGTSGLMSGERKRSVAAWPKLPRLSSTLLAHAGYLLIGCVDRRPRARTCWSAKPPDPGYLRGFTEV